MSSVDGAVSEGTVSEESTVDTGIFLGLDRVVPVRETGGSKPTLFRPPVFAFVLTRYMPPFISQVGLAPALVEGNAECKHATLCGNCPPNLGCCQEVRFVTNE